MGDLSGRLNFTRAKVDHVASEPVITNGFGICYMLNVCVLSCDLSPVVEIWIILSGMFLTLDKKVYIKKIVLCC